MYLSSQDFVKAILLKEDFAYRSMIREVLVPLFEQANTTMTNKLSVTMMLVQESQSKTLDECLAHIKKNFVAVIAIMEEYGIKLPEEEVALADAVKQISEEGEGAASPAVGSTTPTNVTAGIDSSTPRIYPRKRKKSDDEISD